MSFSYTEMFSVLSRGQNFVNSCNRAQAVMDDVLPGVIIEGVLGVEITDIPEITDQLDSPPNDDKSWYKHQVCLLINKPMLQMSTCVFIS